MNIQNLKLIDSKLGKPVTQLRGYFLLLKRYINFLIYRVKRADFLEPKSDANLKHILSELKNEGLVKIENCIPSSSILKIKEFLDESLAKRENLNPNQNAKTNSNQHVPYISVIQPQLYCREILKISLSDLIVDISKCYLRSKPSLTGFNLRKSFVNDTPQQETQLYHSDQNSYKFLKFFIYLNDVDEDGGPLVYMKTSHRKKFWGWLKNYRWDDETIENHYLNKKVLCTGKVGDLYVADTTGFHKGLKPQKNERSMLTITVSIHPDFMDKKQAYVIDESASQQISKDKLSFIDFLRIAN
jgi:hypothetical protein